MLSSILTLLQPVITWFLGVFSRHKTVIIFTVILLLLSGALYYEVNQRQKEKTQYQIANQNLKAASDSIRVSAAKDKQVEFDKYSYIAKQASDLKKVNDSLYIQIKNTKGDVKSAVSTTTVITDSGKLTKDSIVYVPTKDSSKVDADVSVSFKKIYSSGNFHVLSAVIHVKGIPDSLDVTGDLTRDQISMTLFTGIRKNSNGNYEIFARSGYPGVTFAEINGALIDKKIFEQPDKRRIFTLGMSFGYVPFLYDFGSHTKEFFPSKIGATIGVNVNISEIFRKK
jgi:hypothetical protein